MFNLFSWLMPKEKDEITIYIDSVGWDKFYYNKKTDKIYHCINTHNNHDSTEININRLASYLSCIKNMEYFNFDKLPFNEELKSLIIKFKKEYNLF